MKFGKGGDILVSNVVDNPPPPCAVHDFGEWEPAMIWIRASETEAQVGVERICKDCGRYEWTEGASA